MIPEEKDNQQISLWDDLEAQVSGKAIEIVQKTMDEEVKEREKPKRGKPKGSIVKSTATAEDMLAELEAKSGETDKGFQVALFPNEEERAEEALKSYEEKVEELWSIYNRIRHVFKETDRT